MRFGVLQFPGSCDEVDALSAAARVGEAELIWHAERDLAGADAIVVPGGFSYGDYLRAGAIARFSPAMESVIEFAADGGLVLGICNGFQVLCEAHLLPGALLANTNLRFTSRQVELEVAARRHARSRAPVRARQRLSIPAKHSWGRYYADERHARRDGALRPGRAALRTRSQLQRLAARHRRRVQRGGQRVRPDAPPRARRRGADVGGGSVDGLDETSSQSIAR